MESEDEATKRARLTAEIKAEARRLGFDEVGVAEAGETDPARRLRAWLDRGLGGELDYLRNTLETREDVRVYVPRARSVIALLTSYWSPDDEPTAAARIARYARGKDYHNVIRRKLRTLRRFVLERDPGGRCAPSIDFTPVAERAWAARAGLGWIGKSTMLIGREVGTYTFLSALITTLPLDPDPPVRDHCGTCTACLDACPTAAFPEPYVLDARRCISYWTVELRGREDGPDLHGWLAGCDVCQDVCPWNKFARPTRDARFHARPGLADPDLDAWADGPHEALAAQIAGTPLTRIGPEALQALARRARERAELAVDSPPAKAQDTDDAP